jgi:hypothetical protein
MLFVHSAEEEESCAYYKEVSAPEYATENLLQTLQIMCNKRIK